MPIQINGTSGISGVDGSAGTPALQGTDANTGVHFPAADTVAISTNGAQRVTVDSSGNVGIGTTTAPSVNGSGIAIFNSTFPRLTFRNSTTGDTTGDGTQLVQDGLNFNIGNTEAGEIKLFTSNTQRATVDSSGRFLVGTSSATANIRLNQKLAVVSTGQDLYGGASLTSYSGTASGARSVLDFQRSRGTTDGSYTIVANSDELGSIIWRGSDGSQFLDGANISAFVDGTPGANDLPTRLVFSTCPDGSASPVERLRINNVGDVLFNNTSFNDANNGFLIGATGNSYVTASSQTPFHVNRKTNDGSLIVFKQDSTEEGSISVSGTTVSYNGAHLSRWSQLPGGVERVEILRGSVLSNIDEMCEWGEEDNEQLNRMKVSDVEGDKNVAGVFQAWDDDDDTYTNDFYCAMTGDFVIRIAAGVTVERGDLLMSAGDGTAKPQDDDIIRSKTIAKVTSTTVSCTYEDGSYCVPCVLMAC